MSSSSLILSCCCCCSCSSSSSKESAELAAREEEAPFSIFFNSTASPRASLSLRTLFPSLHHWLSLSWQVVWLVVVVANNEVGFSAFNSTSDHFSFSPSSSSCGVMLFSMMGFSLPTIILFPPRRKAFLRRKVELVSFGVNFFVLFVLCSFLCLSPLFSTTSESPTHKRRRGLDSFPIASEASTTAAAAEETGEKTALSSSSHRNEQEEEQQQQQQQQVRGTVEEQEGDMSVRTESAANGVTASNGKIAHSNSNIVSTTNNNNIDIWPDGLQRSFRRSEYIRLLIQALSALGYTTSAGMLESEAGVKLYNDTVAEFRQAVLDGHWTTATSLLNRLEFDEEEKRRKIEFLLLRQQFLELLDRSDTVDALTCLRTRISPLATDPEQLHKLTALLVCRNSEELRVAAQWGGAGPVSRAKLLADLQGLISPSLLIPERRLETLVDQALQLQTTRSLYQPPPHEQLSLFADAVSRSLFPQFTVDVLEGHEDEVWHLQFSHAGDRVASASKDKSVMLWHLSSHTARRCEAHTDAVAYVAWSHDDVWLVSCGNDHVAVLWNTREARVERSFVRHTQPVTACAWLPGNDRFVTGGLDKQIFMWNAHNGTVLMTWPDVRVNDLAMSANGQRMVVVCSEKTIHIHNLVDNTATTIEESDNLRSLHLSPCGRYALVNIATQEVHLWDLDEAVLVQQFRGQKQKHYVIRSTFGGPNLEFVASGSEDSQVYIWHRQTAKLLATLPGHAGTINAVAWDPVDTGRLASASDDNTLRLWSSHPPPSSDVQMPKWTIL